MRQQREVTHWWWDLNHWLSLFPEQWTLICHDNEYWLNSSEQKGAFRYLQTIQDNYVPLTCFSSFFCSYFIYFHLCFFFLVYIHLHALPLKNIYHNLFYYMSLNNDYAISTTFHTYTTTTPKIIKCRYLMHDLREI